MAGKNSAAVGLGASIFIACGLIAIMSSTLVGKASNLSTDQFLQLWSESLLILVFGFLMLISALTLDSESNLTSIIAVGLGAISAFVGALISLILLNLTTGLYSGISSSGSQAAQLEMSSVLLLVAVFVSLLVGFPLGLVGSLGMFHAKAAQTSEQS